MNGTEVLDDYLDGLLQEAAAAAPATQPAAAGCAVEPVPAASQAGAEPVAAAAPDQIAADVLAEMLADPAFAEPSPTAPEPAPGAAERIAAELLAEMDADPAFAGAAPAAAPRRPSIADDLLAEMEADPAFAAAPAVAAAARTIPAASAPAPARTPAAAARAQAPAPRLPGNLQHLLPPDSSESIHSGRRPADRSTRWLRLRCGEQTYALELLKVQEVVLPVPLLRLRGAAPAMLGIMNLRGQVVPVLDLGLHLGAAPVDMDVQTRVVVLEENGETMGLRVSAVEDVASLTDQQIEPPDNARLCRISNHLFRGVARVTQQPMILLDATQLLH